MVFSLINNMWLWINTYGYSLLGDEHPFATYFDVYQGYMVLTHSHVFYCIPNSPWIPTFFLTVIVLPIWYGSTVLES